VSSQKIGKNLKKARLKLNLKQIDVAKRAKISANYYSRIERDEENPTIETLERILKVLKVKSGDILLF